MRPFPAIIAALCVVIASSVALKSGKSGAPIKERLPWYHSSDQVHEAMVEASKSCPEGADVELRSRPLTGGKSEGGQLDVIHIRRTGVTAQTKALFVFGEHARELISVESALDLVRTFCGKGPNAGAAAKVLENVELILVPNANPLSRRKVESGMYCKRTNEDTVDLNRNWGDKHRDEAFIKMTHGDETDAGPRGFSEPETRALRDLVDEERPDIYLSVHSGAHLLGIPYGYASGAKPDNAADMLEVLRPISENHCKGTCPYGNLAQLVGYENGGCDIDYVREQFNTPYVFTWEIYAGASSSSSSSASLAQLRASRKRLHSHQQLQTRLPEEQQDPESCIGHFNPLTEVETKAVLENWTGAYLELCQLVAKKQAVKQDKQAKLGALALGSWLSR